MIYRFYKNLLSRLETIFQLYRFVISTKDPIKFILITVLILTSILFIFFKAFEFIAPFTYLAL